MDSASYRALIALSKTDPALPPRKDTFVGSHSKDSADW